MAVAAVRCGPAFFPTRSLQAPVLQIGKGDAGHQRVPMQAGPGSAFEVAEPKLLLELLVHLLAGPARLDGGDQPPERGPLRQVTEIIPEPRVFSDGEATVTQDT